MLNKLSYKIRTIFIGRKSELGTLDELWDQSTNKKKENLLHVLLNAPGVGKTTLIRHFGYKIEEKQRKVYLYLLMLPPTIAPLLH